MTSRGGARHAGRSPHDGRGRPLVAVNLVHLGGYFSYALECAMWLRRKLDGDQVAGLDGAA